MAVYSLTVDSNGDVVSSGAGPAGVGFSYVISGGDTVSVDCTGGAVTLELPEPNAPTNDITVTKSDSSSNAVSFDGEFSPGWTSPSLSSAGSTATLSVVNGAWIATTSGAGSGAYAGWKVYGTAGTNLGAAYTLDMSEPLTQLVGTLNIDLALTLSSINTAGAAAVLELTQDGTGGRKLTVNGSSVAVNSTAAATSVVNVYSPDGTAIIIEPVSGGGSIASIGGTGVATEGGSITTLDNTGTTRNTLDDGSGNMIVAANITMGSGQGIQNTGGGVALQWGNNGNAFQLVNIIGGANIAFDVDRYLNLTTSAYPIKVQGVFGQTGSATLYSGTGAPSLPGGPNPTAGDIYFRTDTPSTANQRIYICTVGGATPTWVGIV